MNSLLPQPATAPLTLRPYQSAAVEAIYDHLRRREDNPCVVLPTAAGKTPVMASICRDVVKRWGGRVLILAHVKELLDQTARTLQRMAPDLNVGLYSAGLSARDTHQPIIVAGIQSIYRRAHKFDPFDLIIADECHLIPLAGEGMYRTFLSEAAKLNEYIRVIGLTATPYRLKGGLICKPDHFLNSICYEVGVRELIDQGYLCPLKSKAGQTKADLSNLHIRGSEFIPGEVEIAMDNFSLVESACQEIAALTQDRNSVLLFCSSVSHGQHVASMLSRIAGQECGFVCGETPGLQREGLLHRFKRGDLKYLANVNVLTTGFDATNIDCVVLLRPTNSPGLYYQMLGRGFRLDESKQDCLILDYGGNILRHGPVDMLNVREPGQPSQSGESPLKECPKCGEIVSAASRTCPDCGHEFPFEETPAHEAQAAEDDVLSNGVTETSHAVSRVDYAEHHKFNAPPDAPTTMRVEYQVGLNEYIKEWVCFEHTGYALNKARGWWSLRSHEPFPESTPEAVKLAQAGCLAEPDRIVVRTKQGDDFPRIVRYDLQGIPPRLDGQDDRSEPENDYAYDPDDIPF